jgi:hypothetical protein
MNGQIDINIIFQYPVAFFNHLFKRSSPGRVTFVVFLHWWLAMLTCITVISSESCDQISLSSGRL